MPDIIELHSLGNAITGSHDVTLQRLDTLIKNNGRMIHYSKEAFQNVGSWVGVPVIYAETDGATLRHPTHEEVNTGNLPDGYSFAGRVSATNLSASGEPALKGKIDIDDPTLDALVSSGEMSLSTGFGAVITNATGRESIAGVVAPNHVLMFRRGACPNCYPNDNSARFENVMEEEMTSEEEKSFFTKLVEKIENMTPAETVKEEIKETVMTDNTEELKNVTEERDALKAKIEAMENAAEQAKRDAAWNEIKNVLPEGWLGEKEADTRKEFENSAPAFFTKFAKFTAVNGGQAKAAEGSETGTGKEIGNAVETEIKNINAELGKEFGFVISGGDE